MINNYPLNSWGIVVEYLLLFPVDRDTHEFFLPSSERSNVFDAAKDKSVSDHIFEPNGSFCLYTLVPNKTYYTFYPSNIVCDTHGLENWEYHIKFLKIENIT